MRLTSFADPPDLDELVRRFARGDRAAFETFYEHTVDRCMALAMRILGNFAWAEDCVAETYASAWRHATGFDPARANAIGWLFMMCRTRAIDHQRRERAQLRHVRGVTHDLEAEHSQDPASVFGGFLAFAKLQSALEQLTADQRRVLELTYFHALSNSEIADATGMPLGTVKSCIRRGVHVLRKELLSDERDLDTA